MNITENQKFHSNGVMDSKGANTEANEVTNKEARKNSFQLVFELVLELLLDVLHSPAAR